MKEKVTEIIGINLLEFEEFHDEVTADGGLHLILGKVLLATELKIIDINEMNDFIDEIFEVHHRVKFSKN